MSLRQDRLTFFGVLVAVVIAVLGYLQLGTMYPVEGRAEEAAPSRGGADERKGEEEKDKQEADSDKSPQQDGEGGS